LEECLLELKDLIENQDLDDFRGYTSEECDTLLENYFQNPQKASNEEINQNIENLIDYIPEDNNERSGIETILQRILTTNEEESSPLQVLYLITNVLNDLKFLRPAYEGTMGNMINLMLNDLEDGSDLPESLKRAYEQDLEQKLNNLNGFVEKVEKLDGVNEATYDLTGDNFSIYIEPGLNKEELKNSLTKFPSKTRIKEFVAADYELWKTGRALPVFRTNLPPRPRSQHPNPDGSENNDRFGALNQEEIDLWETEKDKLLEKRVSVFDKQLDTLFYALKIPKGPTLDTIAPYLAEHIPEWFKEFRKTSGKNIVRAAVKREKGESVHSYNISKYNIEEADRTFSSLVRTIEYLSDPIFALDMFGEEVTAESVLNYVFIDGNKLSESPYVTETLQEELVDSVIAIYNLNKYHNGEKK
jgi:hypothetical protein